MAAGGLLVPLLAKKVGREKTVILCQLLSIPLVLGFALYARRNLSPNGSLPWGALNGVFFCLEFGLL